MAHKVDFRKGLSSGSFKMEIARFRRRVILLGALISLLVAPTLSWALATAVLPGSRSATLNSAVTAFVTIINTDNFDRTGCAISPATNVPALFSYQTTNPLTNELTGTPDTPVLIPANGIQTYVVAFTPTQSFPPTVVEFDFPCDSPSVTPVIEGVNTLLLSASATPTPDIVALTATQGGAGIVDLAADTGAGSFAVATVNVGSFGSITASVDVGSLPLVYSICETDPGTGQCVGTPGTTVTRSISANETPTYGIFMTATENIPFDPATNRAQVIFKDAGMITRGATSVAVRTFDPTTVSILTMENTQMTAGDVVDAIGGILLVSLFTPDIIAATSDVSAAEAAVAALCSQQGSATLGWDDADSNNVISGGDSFNIRFDNCTGSQGVLDGQVDLSVVSSTGVPGVDTAFSIGLSATMNLSATGAGTLADNSAAISGDFTLSYDTDGTTVMAELASNAVSFTVDTDTIDSLTIIASALDVRVTLVGGELSSLQGSGTVTNNDYLMNVPVDFTMTAGMPAGSTVQITLSDPSGANARITTATDETVTVELDSDGNGTVDETANLADLNELPSSGLLQAVIGLLFGP